MEEQRKNHSKDKPNEYTKLLGDKVKVNLHGPDSVDGTLIFVGKDYLVLETSKDGILFYQLVHVKSVTRSKTGKGSLDHCYDYPKTFEALLGTMKKSWVKVNRGKKDTVEGFLSRIKDGFLVLINGDEIIYVAIAHIKNIREFGDSDDNDHGNKSEASNSTSNQSNENNSHSEKRDNFIGRSAEFFFKDRDLFRIR